MSDQQQTQENPQPVFAIQKLYVNDISVESPNAPMAFMEQEAPEINVSFQNQARAFEGGFHEVSIKATAEAKVGDRILFLIEVTQAGLFSIENVPESDMDPLLGIGCPNIIYPYLRANIADVITRAGFPPVHLAEINFQQMYQQQQAAQADGSPIITQ